MFCDGGALYQVDKNGATTIGTAPGPLLAQDAPDGGIWLYAQTTPVQAADLDGGFSVIPGTEGPVWGSPLGSDAEATYALDNSNQVVLLNGPKKNPIQLGIIPFTAPGVVDPTDGSTFFGADSQGMVWACGVTLTPAALTCVKLCAAADPVVELQFQVVIPLGQVASLWILSRQPLPGGTDLAVLPPGVVTPGLRGVWRSAACRTARRAAARLSARHAELSGSQRAREALPGDSSRPRFPGSDRSARSTWQGSRHLLTLIAAGGAYPRRSTQGK